MVQRVRCCDDDGLDWLTQRNNWGTNILMSGGWIALLLFNAFLRMGLLTVGGMAFWRAHAFHKAIMGFDGSRNSLAGTIIFNKVIGVKEKGS